MAVAAITSSVVIKPHQNVDATVIKGDVKAFRHRAESVSVVSHRSLTAVTQSALVRVGFRTPFDAIWCDREFPEWESLRGRI